MNQVESSPPTFTPDQQRLLDWLGRRGQATASEIIHIGQAVMAQPTPNNSLMYFINTTFNYPTMAEAYRVAALNGYNRLF